MQPHPFAQFVMLVPCAGEVGQRQSVPVDDQVGVGHDGPVYRLLQRQRLFAVAGADLEPGEVEDGSSMHLAWSTVSGRSATR